MAHRFEGYRHAQELACVPVLPALAWPASFLADIAREAITRLRKKGVAVDAVFAGSDLVAMTAMATPRDLGLRTECIVRASA